ncbi:50S ribosomal protein L22 [Candidatus Woesearchaeota archaeon]|nr:50S ribosomal protein L22 [Candidatus Woesearchaeota archaeon]
MNDIAKINGKDLKISTKESIEVCNFIRRRDLVKARRLLENVLKKKIAVPLKLFNTDRGHRPGIGPGSYPMKTSKAILSLLDGVESNAENNGLNKNNLYISKIIANKASRSYKFGRKRGRKMKGTHIYIEVAEKAKKEVKK